jgi:hypothetical protein
MLNEKNEREREREWERKTLLAIKRKSEEVMSKKKSIFHFYYYIVKRERNIGMYLISLEQTRK